MRTLAPLAVLLAPILAPLLASTALPLWADTIAATSRITAITVYPQGAQITRQVVFAAAAGRHDLLITDLPAETDPLLLRLSGDDGLGVGAFSLRNDRLPPRDEVLSPDQTAAKAEVERLEQAEREAQAAVDAISARIEAAEAQAGFLRAVGGQMPDTATPEGLQSIARMIGTEVLAAREQALAATRDLWPLQRALTDVQEALEKARAAFDAAEGVDTDYTALQVAVTKATGGAGNLTVTHFTGSATWRPVYDLRLTRQGGPSLTLARGALVSQDSDEDWSGVTLTLSTAQPGAGAEPTPLWPELRRIAPEEEETDQAEQDGMVRGGVAAPMAEAVVVAESAVATMAFEGDVVVYLYPAAVDVADGVEDVRLALDELTFTPTVQAQAVPRHDRTAFVMANFINTTPEILLPGEAFLYRESVLVGGTHLDSIAPGAEAHVAFGAIEALRLTRDLPNRQEGDRGILSQSSQIEESAILKIENLGAETWPVRMLDLVPYSEQEDLEISVSADPPATETDVDGKRGVLAWEFDLAPGEIREVRLDHTLRWPEGMVLR